MKRTAPTLATTCVLLTFAASALAVRVGDERDWDVEHAAEALPNSAQAYNTAFLTDANLQDLSMSETSIRSFLAVHGSYFRQTVSDVDGVSFDAAHVIRSSCVQYSINPQVILTTLQKESQGVTIGTRPSNARMKLLMGAGSPSTARAQLAFAAQLFRSYQNSQASGGPTVSGWRVGYAKTTLDGVVVTPATKAVAGQFTYTPYAGYQWGGNNSAVGGVYLFYSYWSQFGFGGTSSGETVSAPGTPSGTTSGSPGAAYTYLTGGASSSLGHSVQYLLDWGDGNTSGWLAVGVTSASHAWSSSGTYTVKAQARCATDTSVVSAYSNGLSVTITSGSAPAQMLSPVPGSTFTSSTVTFSWSAGSGVTQYYLYLGNSVGNNDIYAGSQGTNHSVTLINVPSDGRTIYVRLSSLINGTWQFVDYTYRAFTTSSETISTPGIAGPTSGSPGTSYTYSTGGASSSLGHSVQYLLDWGDGNTSGWLAVGVTSASHAWSSSGSYIVKAQARCATDTSVVSAYSNGLSVNITSGSAPAQMLSPVPGSTFTSSTVTFSWSAGSGVTQYYLYLGNYVGDNTIYAGSQGTNHSVTLINVPADGRTIYVRLWSQINGLWYWNDYTYRAL